MHQHSTSCRYTHRADGFTLIELLVVIAIIAILEAQPKSRFRRKTPEFAGSFWRQNRAEAPLRAF